MTEKFPKFQQYLALVFAKLDCRSKTKWPLGLLVAVTILDTLGSGVLFKVGPVVGGGLAELGLVRSIGGQDNDWLRSGWWWY